MARIIDIDQICASIMFPDNKVRSDTLYVLHKLISGNLHLIAVVLENEDPNSELFQQAKDSLQAICGKTSELLLKYTGENQ